jgi:serine protease Do
MYKYKKGKSKFAQVLILISLILISSALSIYIYSMYSKIDVYKEENTDNTYAQRLSTNQNQTENTKIEDVLENTTKCVVGISKIKDTGTTIFLNDSSTNLGLGTGMIVSDNGYILTNWHVAGNKYSTCYVTLENGSTYSGEVNWADSDLDLAIVKINVNDLNYVSLGDSDNIKLGEQTYAIGNPIGVEFQRTVTSGIISGLNRTIKIQEDDKDSYMEDLIQTDATINPGNSGGPLINNNGEVIGVNSVKINNAEGIGFAIPINIVKPVIESFINNKNFEEAYLGIFAYDKNVIPYLNSDLEFTDGIYVVQISNDGPCILSGLKIGDIITKIDNIQINKMSELRSYIYTKNPKDKVVLTITRNKKEYKIEVILGKKQV